MNKQHCERAEVLGGAIALGEATEAERNEYRGHISACAACLAVLGGERDIERVMTVVAQAGESETWQPAISSLHRERTTSRWLKYAFSFASVAIAVSLGLHLLVAASFGHTPPTPTDPLVINYDGTHITLERRQPPARIAKAKTEEPRVVVVHNVITLKPPAVTSAHQETPVDKPAGSAKQTTTTTTVVASNDATPVNLSQPATQVPVWRRDAPHTSSANVAMGATPALEQHAESMAISPGLGSIRDAVPIGGDAAINPQPARIAYTQGAEGTSVFEVAIDERGNPTKCTITKSSGFLVLDDAVCRAAMKARYSPRTINGRSVAGVYRDAFTFRAGTNNEGVDTSGNPQF